MYPPMNGPYDPDMSGRVGPVAAAAAAAVALATQRVLGFNMQSAAAAVVFEILLGD